MLENSRLIGKLGNSDKQLIIFTEAEGVFPVAWAHMGTGKYYPRGYKKAIKEAELSDELRERGFNLRGLALTVVGCFDEIYPH